MNRFEELFTAAGNDYASLLGRTAGDRDMISELMQMFLEDDNMRLLSEALSSKETEKAFRAAHSLKGSSGMLGMMRLHEKLCELTEALRGGDIELALKLYPSAEDEYKSVTALIRDAI